MEKSMASIGSSAEQGIKKPLDISNLMSPPEPPRFDSFSQRRDSNSMGPTISDVRRMGPIPPLSPPISPASKTVDHPVAAMSPTGSPVQDPILYPSQDVANSPQQRPLFGQDEPTDIRRIVDDHVNSRPADLFRQATPPKREEYELFLHFSSQVMKLYSKDPKGWLRRERQLLMSDRKAGARNTQFKLQPKLILPAKPQPIRKETQRAKTTKSAKVVKTAQSQHSAPRPIRSYPAPGSGQTPRQAPKRLPSETADPSPRRAVAPNREDKDFESVPNFCPPLDSLPSKANSLKVDWKGTPIDLSNDQHRHLLHADEVSLAANLRLDCATYLTSKRRMFVRRRECLEVGKEFRKTDAQQACKIDVNKASKLWTAFEKVGWLDKAWMGPYM
ncbi:uncharacterized protein GGS22DRAFT_179196 [Annulohypoxylon maeteangense]|uniref:uncharacterized protein n=1 Tax=Annulohypoxylon maeteangense TaxID=1927788 RepID=UPI0020084750|nr:uncharacterized protein GGS22DRAFT_179196 [Annulohypoxylon maeteangense]KAI0886302.1 hypothetical protein GGS22DRAFT_179196 [Annulohypoxylon maeteangense]